MSKEREQEQMIEEIQQIADPRVTITIGIFLYSPITWTKYAQFKGPIFIRQGTAP